MNDLQPSNGMDLMLQMLGNIKPPNIPQHEFNKGIFFGYMHNKKLKQLEMASESEANISSNRLKTLNNNMSGMIALATFSLRFKNEIASLEQQSQFRELELMKEQAEVKCLMYDAKIKEFQAMEAEFSAKNSALEFELKKKAAE